VLEDRNEAADCAPWRFQAAIDVLTAALRTEAVDVVEARVTSTEQAIRRSSVHEQPRVQPRRRATSRA
jgi:hypothetical protein